MTEDEAVNEELAAQDDGPDNVPFTLGFATYVLTIVLVAFLAVRYGVWVLAVGGTATVVGYAALFGKRRKDGAR